MNGDRPTPRDTGGLVLTLDEGPVAPPERLVLLDGGDEAYPRMLAALERATRSVHLETYAFEVSGVGARFVDALQQAARRGVDVRVVIDGWGSARGGRAVASALRQAGCAVRIYNRLLSVLLLRFARNHRKILLIDERVAFIGGINIGDENIARGARPGWADLTLEIRGPQCARLGQMLRGERTRPIASSVSIHLCGLGGGWRLRRRYIRAFSRARQHIHIAHGYFLPDGGILRSIAGAARRGVDVRLLLAGRTDVPFARVATRSLHRRLLAAGVSIHEWSDSVLHAKVAVVDGRVVLVGSFNLDPFSLVNLEALVEVSDAVVVAQAETWIQEHFEQSSAISSLEAKGILRRWILNPFGNLIGRLAVALSLLVSKRRMRHK